MTTTAPLYTAVLKGTPDVPLSVQGGSLTLDAAAAPHVSGSVVVWRPGTWSLVGGVPTFAVNTTAIGNLDPRTTPRVEVTATATSDTGAVTTRTFKLHLRDRDLDHGPHTISLALASDEALLDDWGPLTDDLSQVAATSLRAVVNYALGQAIPGASLAASPAIDADVTACWAVTNLVANPVPAGSSAGYNAGAGATTPTLVSGTVRWTTTATVSNLIVAPSLTSYRVTPGRWYVFAIEWASASTSRNAQPLIQWRNNGSAAAYANVYGEAKNYSADFQRLYVIAQAPEGAEFAYPIVQTGGNTATTTHLVQKAMFYEGRFLVPFFAGSTTADSRYNYAWADPASPNASSSSRTPIVVRDPESLVMKATQTALEFLAPLVQAAGYRLVCDEARVWTLRSENYSAGSALSIRHSINLREARDRISRSSGLWCDAAVTTHKWTDTSGVQRTQTDAYALTIPYTKRINIEKNTPYPGPGFSEYFVRRAQGRGRELTLTAGADLTATAEQPIVAILEDTPTQVGATQRVRFDINSHEMTITTRTTDTPAGAIDLKTGSIDSLTGTINAQ